MIEFIDYRNNAVEGEVRKLSLFNFQEMLFNTRSTVNDLGKIIVPNWIDAEIRGKLVEYFTPVFFYEISDGMYAIDTRVKKHDRVRKNRLPLYKIRNYAKTIQRDLEKEFGLRNESLFYLHVGKKIEIYAFLKTSVGYRFTYGHDLVHQKTEIFDVEKGKYVPERNKRNPYFVVNEKLRAPRNYLRRKKDVK